MTAPQTGASAVGPASLPTSRRRGIVFSWDISLQWKIEKDPERTSEIEVRFSAESSDRTRVDLEHRNLDHHGEGWEPMRDAVGSPEGWAVGLARFGARVTEAE